ncbi:MAG TPA: MFS transporter [Nitrososphaeraceae archaeon]|nr:MFS transporter [Nitrososphaeraceae archaeon]
MTSLVKQSSLLPILLVNFVGTLGFSIVLPFLVFVVMKFGGNAIVYGLLAATYPAFQLIGSPILGKWSDTYGRKKILLLSNVGTSIGWLLFLFALFLPSNSFNIHIVFLGTFVVIIPLLMLFLARAIDGVTGGNISIANAYLADLSSDSTRSKNFGKMAISSNLGFILGPALAGILGGTMYGAILPVLAALILSLVTIIVIVLLLKESKPRLAEEMLAPEQGTIRKAFSQECRECYLDTSTKKPKLQDVFKLKHISFLLALYFLIFLGFNVYYAAFPTHATKDLKWSVTQLGIFYAILSGIMVFIQGPVLRKALKKFSEEKLVIIGSIILGTNFVLFVSNNIVSVSCAIVLFAVGNGLMWPSFMSILSRYAGSKLQGSVQGVAGSFGGLASILGLILGGFLYNAIGAVTFLISAGVIFSIFLMSFQLLKWK